jgi:hypothetical protein
LGPLLDAARMTILVDRLLPEELWQRGSERFYALLLLACAAICFQGLPPPRW